MKKDEGIRVRHKSNGTHKSFVSSKATTTDLSVGSKTETCLKSTSRFYERNEK